MAVQLLIVAQLEYYYTRRGDGQCGVINWIILSSHLNEGLPWDTCDLHGESQRQFKLYRAGKLQLGYSAHELSDGLSADSPC